MTVSRFGFRWTVLPLAIAFTACATLPQNNFGGLGGAWAVAPPANETRRVEVYFRKLCCDDTTEHGADEVYILVSARKHANGTTLGWEHYRLPEDVDHSTEGSKEHGHWDMNDGDQPNDNASGDSACLTRDPALRPRRLYKGNLEVDEELDLVVQVMEEDGGTTQKYQEAASALLQAHPDTATAGQVLASLTESGFFLSDSDDMLGRFRAAIEHRVKDGNDALVVNWFGDERIVHLVRDPKDKTQGEKAELRMNGDGSDYKIWVAGVTVSQ